MKKIILAALVLMLANGIVYASEPFLGWQKLDKGAQKTWKKVIKDSSKVVQDSSMELMIKTNKPIKKAEKKMFKAVGFEYRSIVPDGSIKDSSRVVQGSIVTGSIPIKNLQCLAAMEFVEYIESAKVLTTKGK